MEKQLNQVAEKSGHTFLTRAALAVGAGVMVLGTQANAALTAADITGPVAANSGIIDAAILAVLGIVLVIWGGKKVIGFFGR